MDELYFSDLNEEEQLEKKILEYITEAYREYSLGLDLLKPEDILKGIESDSEKVKVLTNAIQENGQKKELDLERYENWKGDKVNIEGRVAASTERGDKYELLSLLAGETLSLAELYEQHQNLKTENPEYSSKVEEYNNIYEEWQKFSEEYRVVSLPEDWKARFDEIYKDLEGTPIEQMMNTTIYSEINSTKEGLGIIRELNSNELDNAQTDKEQKQEETTENTQLPDTQNKNILDKIKEIISNFGKYIKEGLSGAGKKIKSIFKGNAEESFDKEIEEITEQSSDENYNTWDTWKTLIGSTVAIPKFDSAKDSELEEIADALFGTKDLGELSQEFLTAKENGDKEQMEKLAERIINLNDQEKLKTYNNLNNNKELANHYIIASGLGKFDTEEYMKTLDNNEIQDSEDIIKAMNIASREKYLDNDFYTNQKIFTDKTLKYKNMSSEKAFSTLSSIYYEMMGVRFGISECSDGALEWNFDSEILERCNSRYNYFTQEARNQDVKEYLDEGDTRFDYGWAKDQPYDAMKTVLNCYCEGYWNCKGIDTSEIENSISNGEIDFYGQAPKDQFEVQQER